MTNPDTPRPLTDLIGLDPNFTGGLSADEYLRRQRCGECDEALRERDTAREQAKQAQAVIAAARAAAAYILEIHPQVRDAAQRGWFHPSTLRLIAAVDALATPTAAPKADEPKPTVCPAEYTRPGGRQRGDRIVRCHLPYGHNGEHEEAETECTWLDEPLPAAAPDPAECTARNAKGYSCTLTPGHDGRHKAEALPKGGGELFIADEWPNTCAAPGPGGVKCGATPGHAMAHWAGGIRTTTWTDREPVPAGGEDGSGTADGEVPA